MLFLNLSLGQFLAVFGAVGAFSVALYLLDRSRRKEVVATLRFWVVPGQPSPVTRRRRIQQPLSLLLQILGMALLLLAVAELQYGGRTGVRRDHVIVLDTSAWMGSQIPNRNNATLMDLARADAIGWLRAVPSADRVMLIRANGLATPATGWETDHAHIIKAIVESQPGATALNLSQSLSFAGQLQRTSGSSGSSSAGEIVYVGPGRLTAREANNLVLPAMGSLRVIAVNDDMPNIGLRSVGASRAANKDAWNILARVHNYTASPQSASITLAFGNAPEGTRNITVPPTSEQEVSFEVPTRAAGLLEARLYPKDSFLPDNYATLELPEMRTARVIVYSDQPDRLRPAFASDPRVTPEFHPAAQYKSEAVPAGTLVVLDRFRPANLPQGALPQGNVLWIDPPAGAGASAIKQTVPHPKDITWTPDHPVTAGLRVRDLQIDQASVFAPAANEVRFASIKEGPIAIASASADGKSHVVTLGFDPFAASLRYELTTPLLLANVLRWMEPGIFRDIDVGTESAGSVVSPAGGTYNKDAIQVISESGATLPFNVRDKQVEFFAGDSSRVRVISGNSERVYSLTLPEMWDVKWTPPATARHGIPAWNDSLRRSSDLWPWLAALGIALLLAEWIIYGRHAVAGLEIHRPKFEGSVSFDRAWALAFLILPLVWLVWEWRKHAKSQRLSHARPVHLILKAVAVILVILAISAPSIIVHESKVAIAVVADTSASLSDADLARENSLIGQIIGAHSANQVFVLPFARAPRPLGPNESAAKLSRTSGSDGRGTNLEAPLRQALASLPSGMLHRITLITDGNENAGSVTRAAWQAQQLGVPVDTIALAGRVQPLLKTEAVGLPGSVFTGERFPVDLTVASPRAVTATVELIAEGKSLGAHPVNLEQGENRVRIRTSLNAAGAIDLSGKISAPGLGESRFENAIAVRKPQIDWISEDPPGTEGHIVDVLAANKFDIVQSKTLPTNLDDAQMVVFNNINTDALADADKTRVESFVQNGGGALLLAGEHTVYVDHKDQPEDALARTFPAKIVPPRSPQGTAVVLVIDKSSSMEGRKMEMARLAAVGVVENLKEDDHVGILIFDNSYMWDVPLRKADNKTLIKREIGGIQADGGTQIAPALTDAYRKILAIDAAYRHIVLLTDGISEEGDSLGLSRDAENNHVTISTVGLGQDVNKQYLEKLAVNAGGKSYFFSNDPQGLEQIVLKDVQEHTGSTAVEKPIKAEVKQPSDLLDKVDIEHAPALAGYVRFETRPSADEILATGEDKDPLLVRWQYGLGRAAIFASDAKSRWAASWLTWPGFDRLWTNVFRDLLPRGNESEAAARYDSAGEDLIVDYHLSAHMAEPAALPALFVIGPGDFRKPLEVSRISPGNYQARVRIGTLEGLFRIRPVEDSKAFPEVGLYRQESELSDYGSNTTLLKSIAQATGGRFNPDVRQLFDNGGKTIVATLRL